MNVEPDYYTGAQLCLKNVKRLLKDAKKCSLPTRAALLELAYEEIGKGFILWTVYWHKTIDKRQEIGPLVRKDSLMNFVENLEPVTSQHLKEFVLEVLDAKTAKDVQRSFKEHPVKLEMLAGLLGVLEKVGPEILAKGIPVINPYNTRSPPIIVRSRLIGRVLTKAINRCQSAISSLRTLTGGRLSLVKEWGFYVELGEDGNFMMPQLSKQIVKDLELLDTSLDSALSIMVKAGPGLDRYLKSLRVPNTP